MILRACVRAYSTAVCMRLLMIMALQASMYDFFYRAYEVV